MAVFPEVRWAQRSNATVAEKNIIYLTVAVPDITGEKIDLTATGLSFWGKDSSNEYEFKIDFFDEIDVEKSHRVKTGRGLAFVLRKKNQQAEYWPRLTKDKVRRPYIRTDFDHWVDEDEQEEAKDDDFGMGGMGGMGGGDMASMLGGAGGAGGAGGNFDMSSLLGGAGGAGGMDMAKLQEMMASQGADPNVNDELSSSLGDAEEDEGTESEVKEVKE